MTNWKTYRWGDIATLEYGKSLRDYRTSSGNIPVFGTNGQVGYTEKALCNFPSVIIGRKGAYRGVHYSSKPFFVIDTAFYLKPKSKNLDLKFAYYNLLLQDINGLDSGSAIPSTRREDFYELEVNLPDLPTQCRIADILSALDEKIELNRRMNQTLEQMAQMLFRQYFVDDIDEEKLPEGWRVGKLGEITVRITKGTTPTTLKKQFVESGINFIKVESITETGSIDLNKLNFIDEETNQLLQRSKVQDRDILFSIAGTLGRMAVVSPEILPANTNQAVAIIRPDNSLIEPLYIYYWLKLEKVREETFSRKVHAVQANLSLSVLSEIEIIIPPLSIQNQKFTEINNLFKKINCNGIEIQKLTTLRDTLLPKLMSGEIDVMQTQAADMHEPILS
ncbi:restriction endonuclease subunit S [Pontibacter diazotrophicus]|uniref:Restriction endonuclease subunit S n=1 Tax=Pontibacter diazotrophicus TaxID=1400979 RepID=A0A3D8LI18_9BACT|nr:restriction endonuclease subunit S [Pontibacter diazotrophicus]RDV16532.1 restriction endonuclease subunit S [Pontibacter diazotrophicus]